MHRNLLRLMCWIIIFGLAACSQPAPDDLAGDPPANGRAESKAIESNHTLKEMAPQIKPGVSNLRPRLRKRVSDSITVVKATLDRRPTYHDGAPVYTVRVRFEKPGRYEARFVKGGDNRKLKSTHTITFNVLPGRPDASPIDIGPFSEKADQPIGVSKQQAVILHWRGIGGRRAAHLALGEPWTLDMIRHSVE